MIPPDIHAENIARGLNAKRNGNGWIARCPVPGHEDRHPSFRINVRDGRLFVRCLAGCSQGSVIDALVHRGLWQRGPNGHRSDHHSDHRAGADRPSTNDKLKEPLKPWLTAMPFRRGSAVDLYLKRRGLEITDEEALSLRFAPSLWHWPSKTKWPAMVAKVALADGTAVTSHMTFIDFDGSGKAPLEKERLFAAGGTTTGAGVWFGRADPTREFVVAEGIESTLSAMRIFNVTAGCAALSEGGIRALILPPEARLVRVFADHDELGQSISAAREAAKRWKAEGRTVAASMAEEPGEDANNVWLRRWRCR